jgi:hypothetical protein
LSAAADLCLQVSGDQGGPTERGKGLNNNSLECQKEKDPTEDIGTYSGARERSSPYSARIARPKLQRRRVRLRSEDCVVQLHKGRSGWSTDSHVTDVVAPHHRGQRLALRNPRQHLIALMLGELRLPSNPYSPCLRTNQDSSVGPGLDGVRIRPIRVFISR